MDVWPYWSGPNRKLKPISTSKDDTTRIVVVGHVSLSLDDVILVAG